MKHIKITSNIVLIVISIFLLISYNMGRKIEKKKSPVKVFLADFSKEFSLSEQFYA